MPISRSARAGSAVSSTTWTAAAARPIATTFSARSTWSTTWTRSTTRACRCPTSRCRRSIARWSWRPSWPSGRARSAASRPFSKEDVRWIHEIAQVVAGSAEEFRRHPALVGYAEIRSPLCFDRNMVESLPGVPQARRAADGRHACRPAARRRRSRRRASWPWAPRRPWRPWCWPMPSATTPWWPWTSRPPTPTCTPGCSSTAAATAAIC